MTDNLVGKPDKADDTVMQKALTLASGELLNAAISLARPVELASSSVLQDNTNSAVKSEVDAETNWHRALTKGEDSLTQAQINERLQDSSLNREDKEFFRMMNDHFSQIAGISEIKEQSPVVIKLSDMIAVGAMNQISPGRIASGLQFMKEHFFELSGLDDKISANRIERLLWDHSFQLYPKETQSLISGLPELFKGVVISPHNFDKTKVPGLGRDETLKQDAAFVSDNLRIQALQKGMFGTKMQRLETNLSSKEAQSQYSIAANATLS